MASQRHGAVPALNSCPGAPATERASLAAIQHLASSMHAPITGISWLAAWPFATSDEQPHAPTLPAGTLPPVDLADFSTYATIARRLEAHEHSSEARQQRMQQLPTPGSLPTRGRCCGPASVKDESAAA